jgi:Uma2 family endonuclease
MSMQVGAPSAADALLAVEVADTTLRYDEGTKLNMYAEAAVQELWIVRVRSRDVRVLREPSGGQYHWERRLTGSESVSPLFAPNAAVSAADIFRI